MREDIDKNIDDIILNIKDMYFIIRDICIIIFKTLNGIMNKWIKE